MSKNIQYWSQVVGPMQGGSWLPGILILQSNGLYAIQKPNGQYLSVDVSGNYQEAPEPRGSWEYFSINSNLNVLNVTPDLITYAIYWHQ